MEKFNLKPVETNIIIHQNNTLNLNELLIFPDKFDGLHLWEAGIILSRWIFFNKEIFSKKFILELGTGVGIGGLTCAKFTECQQVTISDYHPEILKNAQKNIDKNNIQKKCDLIELDWTKHDKFDKKYDIIIGSDLIYAGAPVEDLYQLIKKCLNVDGKVYIIIPNKRFFAQNFLEIVEKDNILEYSKEKIENQNYFCSPLADEKEGFRMYSGLKELEFWVYTFQSIQ